MDFLHTYTNKINLYFDQQALKGEPSSLYEPIDYLMKFGGKRVRPALVLMACHLFDEEVDKALPASYALELFHNFSLMHDDIMDNANLRRGNDTVHVKYDVNAAILSGDVMLIHCYRILCLYDDATSIRLIKIFNKMAIELCEGQRMDMDFEVRDDVSIDEYLKMIEYKTSVLLACALEMGGIIGGGDTTSTRHLYEFGKNIGIAFQIQDDLLDSFGDEAQVGKRPAGDILQNKKTYLYLKTKELADDKQSATLNHYFSSTEFDEAEKIEAVRKLFTNTGAKEYCTQLRDVYRDLAVSHVMQLAEGDKRERLVAFAEYLVKRSN
jgi:geranylgeranyl diphosphate synthase, type II